MVVIQIVGGMQVQSGQLVVTIGSDPGSLIAFPRDVRVQPQHAVIRQVAGRWLIESQGAGLIRVGNGVPTKMGWLTRGDSIKLSDEGPELVFDPPATETPSGPARNVVKQERPDPNTQPTAPSRSNSSVESPQISDEPHKSERANPRARALPATILPRESSWPPRTVLWGGGLLAGGILLAIVWIGSGGRDVTPNAPDRQLKQDDRENPSRTGDSSARRDNRLAPSAEEFARGKETNGTAASAGRATGADAALYLLIVKLPEGGQVCQLGTAFAVAPNRLVTSGGVALGLQSHIAKSRTCWARAVGSPTDREVKSARIHPEYLRAGEQAQKARQESEALRDKIGNPQVGANQLEIAELAELLVATEERVFEAYERQASFDVAVLETAEKLPGTLDLAGAAAGAAPGTRLSVWGVPFGIADYLVDPERSATAVQSSASLLLRLKPANDPALARMVIRCQAPLSGQNWAGSPIVNSAERVVGVYSRPTPPPFEAPDRPTPETHDVVEIDKLQALLPDLNWRD